MQRVRQRSLKTVAIWTLPVAWFALWYFAWFDHDDCLDALRQVGDFDQALYESLVSKCEAAEVRRRLVETLGLLCLVTAEVLLWRSLRSPPA